MRRFTMLAICLLLLACFTATTAWATSPHYKKSPSCVDNGLTLSCTGAIAGLGNFDVLIRLNAAAIVETVCRAPGSGNESPGQNPALPVDVSGGLLIDSQDIKNGNLAFTVTTVAPKTPTPAQAGCPNNKWGVRITNVTFSNGQLRVFQDLNGDGTFDPSELVIGPTAAPTP
jgi:hypothetical protein